MVKEVCKRKSFAIYDQKLIKRIHGSNETLEYLPQKQKQANYRAFYFCKKVRKIITKT